MPRFHLPGRSAVVAAVVFLALSAGAAMAQEQKYHTGGAPTPAAQKAAIPQAPVYRDFLPPAIDLSRYMPAVGDQGNQGSCVGWATAYAARAYYAEQIEHRDISQPANIPSPAWLFDIIHIGNDCEQGAYIPDAMKVLQDGAYSLADFPYDDTKCPRPLPPTKAKATDFRIDSFEQVWDQDRAPDLDKVKGALAQGNPVVILASLDASFFDLNPKNYTWKATKTAKDEGGHAVTLVGYDDATKTFKFINQWTTQWGNGGYARMTYDAFKNRVYEGYIMHFAGDPTPSLQDTDFVADIGPSNNTITPPVIDDPSKFVPPILNVRPLEADRDIALGAATAPVKLPDLQCGHVDVTKTADGSTVALGFVGTQAELDAIDAAVKGKVDATNVDLAPWPACEVRMTLAAQLIDTDAPLAVIDPVAPKVGDAVRIGVQSPGFASYVYASYFSADGTVDTLAQPTSADLKAKSSHTQIKFGNGDNGEAQLTAVAPAGQEMLLVVASEKPLFPASVPETQSDRAFLSSLREAVLAGDSGRITATVLPVTTTE